MPSFPSSPTDAPKNEPLKVELTRYLHKYLPVARWDIDCNNAPSKFIIQIDCREQDTVMWEAEGNGSAWAVVDLRQSEETSKREFDFEISQVITTPASRTTVPAEQDRDTMYAKGKTGRFRLGSAASLSRITYNYQIGKETGEPGYTIYQDKQGQWSPGVGRVLPAERSEQKRPKDWHWQFSKSYTLVLDSPELKKVGQMVGLVACMFLEARALAARTLEDPSTQLSCPFLSPNALRALCQTKEQREITVFAPNPAREKLDLLQVSSPIMA
ncbi:hypothetical protein R3P38DRAFT_3228696 [Favolaschia claudopus]|uniref:Uncharacterized protein n=1 Tax=Favolaschia claudopus TaxID=2862362 RepID=A0AAV9ZRE7_9AGAR